MFPQQELINQIEEADVILAEGPHLVRPAVQLSENSVILYSSHNVEIDRWSHLQNTYLKDRYYNSLKKSESFAVSESDGVICVSEQDLQRFSEIYGSVSNPVIVPNGTYESNIHNNVDRSSSNVRKDLGIDLDQTVALFVGSDYGPNVDAARKIVTWSEQACDENQDIHFLLVGNVGNRIDADNNHLTVTGFVDNIEPMYACADIALNPITDGAGSNIKIIDYLARGLPVISTPFGVRGFEFEENTIIINEIESIYNRVKEYGSGSKQIQQRKIQTVASKYTWHTLSKKLLSYLGENFNAE
ncbi:glycosyltransferase family 4 protein [Halopenitus malekzadehii]|uniref:glycosyltransferase family 4 protein n=1 Tax=Halopenitus malekzadehii TaxID=1267564 RepID=UPI0015A624FA|nr:glycosyltransferase family 4 protein [Halopenitus malekzadehii]